MWYLRSLEHASVIQKLTILEHKNGLVLSNTRVPVSGTWTILFPEVPSSVHGQIFIETMRGPLKNHFPKGICNEIWLKLGDHEYINIAEIIFG